MSETGAHLYVLCHRCQQYAAEEHQTLCKTCALEARAEKAEHERDAYREVLCMGANARPNPKKTFGTVLRNAKIADLKKRVEEMKNDRTQLQQRIVELERKLTDALRELDKTRSENGVYISRSIDQKKRIAELEQKLANLDDQLHEVEMSQLGQAIRDVATWKERAEVADKAAKEEERRTAHAEGWQRGYAAANRSDKVRYENLEKAKSELDEMTKQRDRWKTQAEVAEKALKAEMNRANDNSNIAVKFERQRDAARAEELRATRELQLAQAEIIEANATIEKLRPQALKMVQLQKTFGKLAAALGNPALIACDDQTSEEALVEFVKKRVIDFEAKIARDEERTVREHAERDALRAKLSTWRRTAEQYADQLNKRTAKDVLKESDEQIAVTAAAMYDNGGDYRISVNLPDKPGTYWMIICPHCGGGFWRNSPTLKTEDVTCPGCKALVDDEPDSDAEPETYPDGRSKKWKCVVCGTPYQFRAPPKDGTLTCEKCKTVQKKEAKDDDR